MPGASLDWKKLYLVWHCTVTHLDQQLWSVHLFYQTTQLMLQTWRCWDQRCYTKLQWYITKFCILRENSKPITNFTLTRRFTLYQSLRSDSNFMWISLHSLWSQKTRKNRCNIEATIAHDRTVCNHRCEELCQNDLRRRRTRHNNHRQSQDSVNKGSRDGRDKTGHRPTYTNYNITIQRYRAERTSRVRSW